MHFCFCGSVWILALWGDGESDNTLSFPRRRESISLSFGNFRVSENGGKAAANGKSHSFMPDCGGDDRIGANAEEENVFCQMRQQVAVCVMGLCYAALCADCF